MNPESSYTAWQGRLLAVTVETWEGREREIVEHPGAVAIVAVDRDQHVWLVRQLRESVRAKLVELPAGTCEHGEEPLQAAKRELREECGLTGGVWRELSAFWTTPGFCRELMHVFFAEGVEEGDRQPEDDESIELVRVPLAEIASRLGELEDAKTLAGLLLYLRSRGL